MSAAQKLDSLSFVFGNNGENVFLSISEAELIDVNCHDFSELTFVCNS